MGNNSMDLGHFPYLLTDGPISSPRHQALSDSLDSRLTYCRSRADDDSGEQSADPRTDTRLSSGNSNQTGMVINKIEDIFESIAGCILDGKEQVSIHLKSRNKPGNQRHSNNSTGAQKPVEGNLRRIAFPSKTPQEAWKFTALLRILELSHEALVTGVTTTKRDIYYRDPELFVKQTVVDRYVDDIAFTLGVQRDALNVVAAAKGLVVGSFTVVKADKSTVDCSIERGGILIPNTKDFVDIEIHDIRWVLIVEKEATFRTLATSGYWEDSLAGKGILITAKGYPDIQTRQFLHLLHECHSGVPIFALVDFDPDGIGIMSTYKHGSVNLSHELNLSVTTVQWLGVRSRDFLQADVQGLRKLSNRDRRIAVKMLQKDIFDEDGQEQEWRRELQIMLMLNVKAEIQIVGSEEKLGVWLNIRLLDAISI